MSLCTALGHARMVLAGLGLLVDRGTWLEAGRVLSCAYPRRDVALAALAAQGVSVLVNLHERAHEPLRLARHDLREVHLPVVDFTAPSPVQLDQGIAAIVAALGAGRCVAVHCGGGLGRTGTLLACYLVYRGLSPEAALERVRAARPGSVETSAQTAALLDYARRRPRDTV